MKNDPTTDRVVSELAEALLPRLKEVVVRELSSARQVIPQETEQDADAALIALDCLRETAAGLRTELERLFREVGSSAERLKNNEDTAAETLALLRSLEAALPGWEGILKADGRAHTRELSELSAEMSELLRDTRSTLLTEVRDVVEKEFAKRDERLERFLRESATQTELKKIVVASTAISAALLAAVLAMLAIWHWY